ncbi:restriction endonuclease subunit S [Aquabacterium sp.]|uniref:restriction endonuclease subunit S n=1 Tax=Aquabacterium sp. TaxID=1872578 RepID=UPI003CFCB159
MSSEWPLVKLGDLTVNLDTKRKPVKEADRKSGPYPYYGASGIVDYVAGYIFDGDHLLIAEDGENLRTRQTPIAFRACGKFWVNNHAHIVVGNERASTRYLEYAVLGSDITSYLTGAVMPKLTQGNLNRIEVPCPPREVQDAIVGVLGGLDDRITLLRETNATLEAIAQALFKSWFVDFDPVRAKMAGRSPEGMDEATAALFPDSMEEAGLGAVPKGWRHASLTSICSYISRGLSPKYMEAGGVLVLNQKCIRDFSVDYSKGRRHDPALRKIDGRLVSKGDVLVNSTGVGTLGRVAQILELPEPAIVDSHVTVVRAGEQVSWLYLGQWMAARQPEIEAMGEGSTGQTELSRSKMGCMPILVPTRNVLSAFDSVVLPLKERISLNERSIQTLATLRDNLLPRLISGRLRLQDAVSLCPEVV